MTPNPLLERLPGRYVSQAPYDPQGIEQLTPSRSGSSPLRNGG